MKSDVTYAYLKQIKYVLQDFESNAFAHSLAVDVFQNSNENPDVLNMSMEEAEQKYSSFKFWHVILKNIEKVKPRINAKQLK